MKSSTIVDQWETNAEYRLVLVDHGPYVFDTARNYFLLEMRSTDSQGESCWVDTVHQHARDITNALSARIKELHARNSHK